MSQTQVIAQINQFTGQTGVTADNNGAGGATRLYTTQFGSGAKISVQSNVAAANNSSGFGTAQTQVQGTDIAGTIGTYAATGNGNVLTGTTGAGAQGISIAVTGMATTISTVSGAQGNVTVQDNSLTFQIGANAGQTAKVAVDNAHTSALGINVVGAQFGNLSQVDVRTTSGAQDTIKVVDSAIGTISTLRGRLGAFQSQTLESTANNLRSTLENTTSAESVIRDTDFAAETANFTKNQVLLQAGSTVLNNANQTSQLVLALLGR